MEWFWSLFPSLEEEGSINDAFIESLLQWRRELNDVKVWRQNRVDH